MVMRTYTENTYFGDVHNLFSGPSLVEVRAPVELFSIFTLSLESTVPSLIVTCGARYVR